jgi:hypothetical protein
VDADLSSLPDDIDALKAALIAARTEAAAEKARAVAAGAELAHGRALIAHLNLEIEKLRRTIYGPRSERTARLLDQLELQLEEAEAGATEDELAAEQAKRSSLVKSFERKRPTRKPFPDHLPRERVVIPAPETCPCCGSAKLSKGFAGILQADAYSGYNRLYLADRRPGPILEALCWSHGRRKFFELADIAASARRGKDAAPISPIALEAVRRIDAVFDIEREINGFSAEDRLAARRLRIAPLIAALEEWMRAERAKLSRHNAVAKAIDYMLTRWPAFTRFLEDGRICLTNNAAERALRGLALGRKSWLFAGSARGAERAAITYTLIETAKLNEVDPQAWLADVLARIADHPAADLIALPPWRSCRGRRPR